MISGHVTLKTAAIAAENSALPSQEYIFFQIIIIFHNITILL